MPLLPLVLSALAVMDAATAFHAGRTGRGAFKVVSVLVWLFVAYMLYETNKRIQTGDQ